jgi:uncharacterized protein
MALSPRTIVRRTVLTFTTLVVGGYLALLVYLRLNESALLFPRISVAELPGPDSALQLPFSNVSFDTEDGVRLNAWAIPAPTEADMAPWILLAHGQTGNVATTVRPKYYAHLRQLGLNILAFDWRGFGASAGTPSEEGLYRDASAAYAYLRNSLGVPAERIIIYGHSLGTAPAIELATRVKAAALIIEGAPYSIRARAQEVYPLVPIRLIAKSEFNSLQRIGSVKIPTLVMHATEDGTIPIAHGRRLFEAANEPKRFVELRGGHGDAFEADSGLYFGAYASFLRGLHITPVLTSR